MLLSPSDNNRILFLHRVPPRPIRPPMPGINLPGVFAVRTIPDSRRIRSWITEHHAKTAVVIGGGFIGLEMVENLIHRELFVAILEKLPQVMPPLDPEMAAPLAQHLAAKGVRLHLRFHLTEDRPVDARITKGSDCERQALRQMCVPGQTNVGDRYYGEDYQLFGEIDQAQAFFVIRIKEDAVVQVEEELALSPEDQAAGVVRHAWVRLGARAKTRSMRLRLVEIRAGDQHLLLVTNLPVAKAPAQLVGLIYRRRWSIELFFRWVKCILGCRHFFAESPQGVALQLYLALIAAVLFQFYSGRRPSKRQMELIQMYLLGWATAEELVRLLQEPARRESARKKS